MDAMLTTAVAAAEESSATGWQLGGAFAFGAVIGWFIYFLNRYRKEVVLGDLTTVVSAVGGAAVLVLFPAGTDLFGAYGIGLAAGFFGYLALLVVLVMLSDEFDLNYLIDGRRKDPQSGSGLPDTGRGPMQTEVRAPDGA
ncbi:hypothetical protein [Agrococcus sp. Marseille-P2731]|uniref:hypothetical protein n=1 Tax=Agrococcus sp. Marseille-P2731 TaxID=1841862 RepID=UPI0009F84E44|nr:hypothetical protein [Agrococcus sp. Marseille-P2731]